MIISFIAIIIGSTTNKTVHDELSILGVKAPKENLQWEKFHFNCTSIYLMETSLVLNSRCWNSLLTSHVNIFNFKFQILLWIPGTITFTHV